MPSSKDRQRVEIPVHFYEQLAQIAETEDRTEARYQTTGLRTAQTATGAARGAARSALPTG